MDWSERNRLFDSLVDGVESIFIKYTDKGLEEKFVLETIEDCVKFMKRELERKKPA